MPFPMRLFDRPDRLQVRTRRHGHVKEFAPGDGGEIYWQLARLKRRKLIVGDVNSLWKVKLV